MDPDLKLAFKRQCLFAQRSGLPALAVWFLWRGTAGVDDDELLDIAKKVDEFVPVPRFYEAMEAEAEE